MEELTIIFVNYKSMKKHSILEYLYIHDICIYFKRRPQLTGTVKRVIS